jgi:hypothetical protein
VLQETAADLQHAQLGLLVVSCLHADFPEPGIVLNPKTQVYKAIILLCLAAP